MGIELLLQPREIPFQLVYGLFSRSFRSAFSIESERRFRDELVKHYEGFLNEALFHPEARILYEVTPKKYFQVSSYQFESRHGPSCGFTTINGLLEKDFGAGDDLLLHSWQSRLFDRKAYVLLRSKYDKIHLLPRRIFKKPILPGSRLIAPVTNTVM